MWYGLPTPLIQLLSRHQSSLFRWLVLCAISLFPLLSQAADQAPEEGAAQFAVKTFYLQGFVSHPELGITETALAEKLVSLQQEFGEQLTLEQLHFISDEITRWYQDAGLMLVKARIPPQEITDAAVTLAIQEGQLAEVVVIGADRYNPKVIAKSFEPLLNQSVSRDQVQEALLLAEDLPGMDVFGSKEAQMILR